jgi:valyl-tRNA synthetase
MSVNDMSDFSPESLPNRFDFADAQPRIYAAWEAARVFHAEPPAEGAKDTSKGPYSIVIPPPNVTGALHLGHALNNTLQDIQIRLHRMQGYNVCWMPGTDHAGIATQAVVEKRLREEEKKTRHDLGREKLVERIWEWKEQYEARILSQLKRMGASCDWDRTRFTLDEGCSRAVRQTFFDLFSKGLIYRGKRLVNWDTFLQTAVSDDEVFQETVKGKFWHFRYPVINPKAGEPTHVTIATTRPETMLGDTAVAVHPEPAKALDKAEAELQERLEKAAAKEKEPIQAQIDNIRERRNTMLPQLELLAKMARDGRRLILPLLNREIPLVADEWAKPEMGSGCVKITPAHDPNDYLVGQRQKLPMINILNPDGTLNSEAGAYKGLTIPKAREKVVADLDALGLLGEVEDRDIELPHSDRSKTPIEPYLADQWFVKMGDIEDLVQSEGKVIDNGIRPGLAQTAMDAVMSGRVKILPERYAKSYLDWLGEKRDWPVSRQLWWGHRIPIWTKAFRGMEQRNEVERLATKLLPNGCDENANFYMQWDPDTIEGNAFICLAADDSGLVSKIEAAGFVHDPDVLDTWFSSALWPHSTFGWPEKTPALDYWYPTSVLITSRDIITLWVARMVLTGLNNMGEIPFREVFIHPKILDGYGETMSKSKGNGVDPIDVIDKFGADALRYGLASLCTETQDVRMPVQFECPHCEALIDQTKKNRELPKIGCTKCGKEFSTQWARTDADKALPRGAVVSERFEVSRNFTNKLWNAARFALINLQGFTPGPVQESELTVEDRWLLSRLATVTAETTAALENYHYADAAKSLYDFAWDEFCSFYIEMAKPRLADPAQKQHAQRLLAHSLDVLLRLLHPMMPFITEDIWQHLNKLAPERGIQPDGSACGSASSQLILAPWPQADLGHQNKTIESQFSVFQQALAAIREIRNRQNIAMKNEIEFAVKCDAATAKLLQPMAPYFQSMANARGVAWGESITPPATHAKTSLAGLEIYVDLKDFIDVKAEIAKNEKEEQRLAGLVKSKEAKLASENFVARAPANVVQAERDSLAQAKEQLASVQASLVSLRKQK